MKTLAGDWSKINTICDSSFDIEASRLLYQKLRRRLVRIAERRRTPKNALEFFSVLLIDSWNRQSTVASRNNKKTEGLWYAEEYGPKARFIPAWANGPGIDP